MIPIFDPVSSLKALKLPAATHIQLAFCGGNKPGRVRTWVEQLRATQAAQTSVSLYQALPEVLRLKTDVVSRYEMLEILRPAVHQAIQGLTKDFLHQPLQLPEQAQKTAIVAQALQKNMIDGYTQVALELAESSKVNNYERLVFGQALHRAITGLGLFFCRSFQLYSQVPKGLWSHLHTLYRCARYYEMEDNAVQDDVYGTGLSTIAHAYLRVLALGAGRLNQVAQKDVQAVFDVLADWSRHIRLLPELSDDPDNLYVVNPERDRGPQLKHRLGGTDASAFLELNFKPLLAQLDRKEQQLSNEALMGAKRLQIPDDFSSLLLLHLQHAWGNVSDRDLERRPVGAEAAVSIGISECHYQLAGEQPFNSFLQVANHNDEEALPTFANMASLGRQVKEQNEARFLHLGQVYDVTLQNLSAGGYCLLWQGEVPARLEAGELIALREAGRRSWSLCVVRWIRRLKDGSQTGLQLVSTQAQAFAASAQYDDGTYSDYMRAFYVPASKQGEIPPSVLTAAMPFQEYQSVRLKQDEHMVPAKLEKCVFATAKIRQFEFRPLNSSN